MLKRLISFGYKYGDDPPESPGTVVVDVRQMFRNPFRDRKLRYKRGTDPEVQADVMKTPNFYAKFNHLRDTVTAPGTEVAYIGCTGGRHRSVFLVQKLGEQLGIPVEHRDIAKEG